MPAHPAPDTGLVVGWTVNHQGDPVYWLSKDAKPGLQASEDLVILDPADMACHTCVAAQSGSGKSFLLGRILEELLLKTRSRVVVLDPNADFRRVARVAGRELWESAHYDARNRKGKLPHEATRDLFKAAWATVTVEVRTADVTASADTQTPLQIWWPSLAVEFITEEVEPELRSAVYHCHSFVQAVSSLVLFKDRAMGTSTDVIEEAERLMIPGQDPLKSRAALEAEYDVPALSKKYAAARLSGTDLSVTSRFARRLYVARLQRRAERAMDVAAAALTYITVEAKRFYFGRACRYRGTGILADRPVGGDREARFEVVDLASLPDRGTRHLVVSALLATEWSDARNLWSLALQNDEAEDKRIPTFIVVDEAHNLIPIEPQTASEFALREQFRAIAAEGRKYGLFLLLVSQRPDKLDPLLISECQNTCLMKIGSRHVLEAAQSLLGLDDVPRKLLDKCLEFGKGGALLVGPWTRGDARLLYSAARRTVEGGRDLQPKHWAKPADATAAAVAAAEAGRKKPGAKPRAKPPPGPKR